MRYSSLAERKTVKGVFLRPKREATYEKSNFIQAMARADDFLTNHPKKPSKKKEINYDY